MTSAIISFSAPGLLVTIVFLSIFWEVISPKWPLISWAILCTTMLIYATLKILWEKRYMDEKELIRQDEIPLQYAIKEAFAGDFTSLKERFRLKDTQLFEPTSLEELINLQKELFQQFRDEVIKRAE